MAMFNSYVKLPEGKKKNCHCLGVNWHCCLLSWEMLILQMVGENHAAYPCWLLEGKDISEANDEACPQFKARSVFRTIQITSMTTQPLKCWNIIFYMMKSATNGIQLESIWILFLASAKGRLSHPPMFRAAYWPHRTGAWSHSLSANMAGEVRNSSEIWVEAEFSWVFVIFGRFQRVFNESSHLNWWTFIG